MAGVLTGVAKVHTQRSRTTAKHKKRRRRVPKCRKVSLVLVLLSLSLSLSFSFSPPENKDKIVRLLSRALHRIRTTPPRVIASPATREFIPTARRPLGFTSSQNRVAPPWPSSFASFPLQLPPRFPQMLPSRRSVNFLSSTGSRTLPLALKFFSCRETTLLPRTS